MDMKTIIRTALVLILTYTVGIAGAMAQRVITGTVYIDGQPAAGVTVTANRSNSTFFTSFDGKYKLEISDKSKYLKFTYAAGEEKLDIEGNNKDVINMYIGKKPDNAESEEPGVDLRSQTDLVKAKDKDYMSNYSMYDQFYRMKDYKSALKPWEYIYHQYPKSSVNVYIVGIKMYEDMLDKATDAEKPALLDKLLSIYDKRMKYFDDKGYLLGRKATSYLKYKLEHADQLTDDQLKEIYKTGYGWLEQSMELQGNKTEAAVLVQLMQGTNVLFKTGEFQADKVMENYDKTLAIANANLAKDPNMEAYKQASDAINTIFENSGAADCETLIKLYTPKFKSNPNDVDMLRKMLYMLNSENCTDSKLYADAADKLYQLEPSAQSAFSMARLYIKLNEFDKAIKYYKEAISREEDAKQKALDLYELGTVELSQGQYQAARSDARDAIKLEPKNGKPYLLLGSIYAASAKNFGKSDFDKAMVFVLAVDYFEKAKAVDSSVADDANKNINIYKKYFPDKENAFFQGYNAGDTYKVEGWINETTKVRLR